MFTSLKIGSCFKIATVVAVAVLFLALPFLAIAADIEIPQPTGFVTDVANQLSSDVKQSLELKLADYEKQTGTEIAVLIIPLIPEGLTANEYATKVGNSWGVQKKGAANGVVFLVETDDAPGQNDIYIAPGRQIAGVLTDVITKHIQDEVIVPRFKNGDLASGITAGVDAIILSINGESFTNLRIQGSGQDEEIGAIQILALVIVFILLPTGWILGRNKSWWGGGILGVIGGVAIAYALELDQLMTGLISFFLGVFGLGFDYFMSKHPKVSDACGTLFVWIIMNMLRGRRGGGGGGSGGGFGGFGGGGGGFDGGGSGSKW